MKPYEKLYREFFGLAPNESFPCEFGKCRRPAHSCHHVSLRGMGGDPTGSKDRIDNLVGLCLEHHLEAERDVEFNMELAVFAKNTTMRKEWMFRATMEEL